VDPTARITMASMKRTIGVWALWLSILLVLALPTLWVTSYFIPRSENCVAIRHDFFAILRDGRIELASQINTDSGYPQPAVVNPRLIMAPKVLRSAGLAVSGFEFHFCALAGGNLIWSLSMSLLIPTVVAALSTVILFHRLRRRPSPAPGAPRHDAR
jgi:hypothetical protein